MSNDLRLPLAVLSLSAAALVGLVVNEGYTDKAIIPVPGDKPTMGFGSTGSDIKLGDKTTPPKALARALRDVQQFEGALKGCIKVELHQYEYDAFLDLAYNIGPTAFCGSTLVKRVNERQYAAACGQILNWKFYQGHDCSLLDNKHLCGGLWVRRRYGYQLCMGERSN